MLAAARAAGEPVTVEELNDWPATRGGGGENVVPVIRAAAAALETETEVWKAFGRADTTVPLSDEDAAAMGAVVQAYAGVLRTLGDALDRPHSVDWQPGYTSPLISHSYPITDLKGTRDLALLFHADALLAHRAGDRRQALRRAGQILSLGRAVDYQPGLIPHLVAVGITAMSVGAAGEVVPELAVPRDVPPDEVRALIARLLDDLPMRAGLRRAMVTERVMEVDAIEAILAGRMVMRDLTGKDMGTAKPGRLLRYVARPYLLDNAVAAAGYTSRGVKASGAKDLVSYRQVVPEEPEYRDKLWRYMLASILAPSLDRVGQANFRCIAEQRLTAAALAVKLYEAEHEGRGPGTLNDLVPAYLPQVPHDPFLTGDAPIRYVPASEDPKRPRLYSDAANGVDHGGNEPPADASLRVWQATSDIVRHLKRQPRVFPRTMPVFRGLPGMGLEEPPATGPTTQPATMPVVEEEQRA
jgi:hypothetical protein